MIIYFKKKNSKFLLLFIGLFILIMISGVFIDIEMRNLLIGFAVPLILVIYTVVIIFTKNKNCAHITKEKFICNDTKRNIKVESDIKAIKVSKYYWQKNTVDKTYDIPVVKVETGDGQSVSFAVGGFSAYEWVDKVDNVSDFDIELDYEEWDKLVVVLNLSDQLKRKPIVIPQQIREPMAKIMYLILFGVIGLAAYLLYWGIYIEKVFEV